MTNRITQTDLNRMVDTINELTNNPMQPYNNLGTESFKVNAGNYHLDYAYGGVKLCQMCLGGGTRDISTMGYGTKKELYNWMVAFKRGLTTPISQVA